MMEGCRLLGGVDNLALLARAAEVKTIFHYYRSVIVKISLVAFFNKQKDTDDAEYML
jgi:hypothetical protein